MVQAQTTFALHWTAHSYDLVISPRLWWPVLKIIPHWDICTNNLFTFRLRDPSEMQPNAHHVLTENPEGPRDLVPPPLSASTLSHFILLHCCPQARQAALIPGPSHFLQKKQSLYPSPSQSHDPSSHTQTSSPCAHQQLYEHFCSS